MLDELRIADLGVIAEARLPLGPGFTAVTGETGAGKTMVVTALGLLMGQRADAGVVRQGTDNARVAGAVLTENDAVHEIVADAGGVVENDELLLSRTVSAEGRSRATVGGVRAPNQTLQQLSEYLFTLHGQSDQIRLTGKTQQRNTLDRFGGVSLAEAKAAYERAFTELRDLRHELDEVTGARDERRREAERLRAEVDEITALDPQPGEDDELQATVARLGNLEALRSSLAQASAAIAHDSDDPYSQDALTLLGAAESALGQVSDVDPQLEEMRDGVSGILTQLDEIGRDILRYASDLDAEGPAQLATAQQRLHDLTALKRSYGPELDDVLTHVGQASERLATLDNDDQRVAELDELITAAQGRESVARERLTALRREAAQTLSERVTGELGALALGDMQFEARLLERDEPAVYGAEDVELAIASYAGGPLRPLAKGASGGELSRVMLAIEVVLAGTDPVPTFVFDEVDAGVGGSAAIEVGRRLAQLSRTAQVIVVTHLAQVAAFANNHVRVVKDTSGAYTASSLVQLEGEDREREMARLLSGLDDSESAREHARELLQMGRDARDANKS